MRKHIGKLTLVFILLAALTGCGNGGQDASGTQGDTGAASGVQGSTDAPGSQGESGDSSAPDQSIVPAGLHQVEITG